MMCRKNGFSLVELIVVIIILILALAILLPILSQSRISYRYFICQNNLRGYGTAFIIYLDDYDQRFPDASKWLFNNLNPNDKCRWHNNARNLVNRPQEAGVFWKYVADKDNHLCSTFDRLAVSGLGAKHQGHDPMIPIDPQNSYSMNGYLGPGRFGVVEKLGQITASPERVLSFTEQNVMWYIPGRSRPHPDVNVFMFLSRAEPYESENYYHSFATYHLAPSEDIEIDEQGFAVRNGNEYPQWGLCRGSANALFLDLHVELEMLPCTVDAFDYSWPLLSKTDGAVKK